MKITLLISLLFIINISFAQTENVVKYANTITKEDLKKHLSIIASDEMEGRETGTEGIKKAATYIESQFKLLGLTPAISPNLFQQLYPIYKDSPIVCTIEINGKELSGESDYVVPTNINESQEIRSEKIVFAGYGISDKNYDDYNGKNVENKIVIFSMGEPKQGENFLISGTKNPSKWSSRQGLIERLYLAKQKGAIAALVINPIFEKFDEGIIKMNKKAIFIYPKENNNTINCIMLSHTAAKNILGDNNFDKYLKKVKEFALLNDENNEKKIEFSFTYKKNREKINASNIIAMIEGSDKKDEYVFITAHYDHLGKHDGKIYYGADDDGSGTCAVLEIAEAFKKAKEEGNGPRRTVVCMTVSGEEKGLWGSEYYSDNPVLPLEKTSVDLNIDMIGRIDTERQTADSSNYVYVVGHDKISSDLPIINEGANNKYTQLQLDYKFDDPMDPHRIYFRSDHYNFARKGVPVLFFYDGMLKADYHQPGDTIDKINWDLYEKRTRMIFYTAWQIANRDEMLKRDKPIPEGRR